MGLLSLNRSWMHFHAVPTTWPCKNLEYPSVRLLTCKLGVRLWSSGRRIMWGFLSVCQTRLRVSHLCLCPLSFASWGLSMLQAENKVFHFFPKLSVWKLQRWGLRCMFVQTASVQIYPFSVLRFPLSLDFRTTCPSCLSVSPGSESHCTSLTVFNILATKGWVPQGQTNISSFFLAQDKTAAEQCWITMVTTIA